MPGEFSFRTRQKALERFRSETFDLLVIGGGITGAAVARDAVSRGLKVALIEKYDFAFGTSSRSSKLIHGGLRYLENLEFGLVFEALAERALLLKTVPALVKPLPFYLPVYAGQTKGRGILNLGLWLYDLLALFRTPGFHRSLSKKKILQEIPFLKSEGLKGGFRYFDASMWDDLLAVEILRAASQKGAAVANYVEALEPLWKDQTIAGFRVRDRENQTQGQTFEIHATRTVVCVGPWTDLLGSSLSKSWKPWLNPSKGVHLIFDLKRIPIPGAMVMSHPEDGRISFVIPRPDYGAGVVIVGTTDAPTAPEPEKAEISPTDVRYLLDLLNRYFPDLHLTAEDIVSAYVGVRPLVGSSVHRIEDSQTGSSSESLQKVSREHHIDRGPGGTVIVAGGKYTTHRKMAEEIVDFAVKQWGEDAQKNPRMAPPPALEKPETRTPINPMTTHEAMSRVEIKSGHIPSELSRLYGAESEEIVKIHESSKAARQPFSRPDPEGFPLLEAQLRFAMREQMVAHLEDFYLRRTALFASRKDQGLPWAEPLSQVWAEELGLAQSEAQSEKKRLEAELKHRSQWRSNS